jgi:hypothetical protein
VGPAFLSEKALGKPGGDGPFDRDAPACERSGYLAELPAYCGRNTYDSRTSSASRAKA